MTASAPVTAVPMPTGTVTFLFTDIEGSTKLLQRVGDEFSDLLAQHHRILRDAIAARRGYEVATAGDGFFVAFAEPTNAVLAALDAQRALAAATWPRDERVRVRMGVHSGEVQVSGDNYVGMSVHQASRISSAGHGGQVLVSDTTRSLVQDGAIAFEELGAFSLKDLAGPVLLHQLAYAERPSNLPPIRALNERESNLPLTRTSFVGRQSAVEDLLDLLERPGLITLTGPGGCGKTRLSIEAARAAMERGLSRCWFVDLRSAGDEASALDAAAAALRIGESDEGERLALIAARLDQAPSLLILDNCEHLVDACAQVADDLLHRCGELRIIATSRDLLGVQGEVARRVASLAVPPEGATRTEAAAFPAVELFVERAERVAPAFALTETNVDAVGRICRRLDGIPLALELAAARVRHMKPAALEERLADMFRVLVGSDRRAVQRHQTLEAVVRWSYDLLSESEQALLRRLAVFFGSFSMASAEDVCGEAPLERSDVSDMLFALVDRSIVERDEDADRYRLLEPIRQFAQARATEAGEAEQIRTRHLKAFVDFAEQIGPLPTMSISFEAIELAAADADNLKAAFEWAVESGARTEALRLAEATAFFFGILGRKADVVSLSEGIERLGGEDAERARAEVSVAFARPMVLSFDIPRALAAADLMERHADAGDPWIPLALLVAGASEAYSGEPAKALAYAERAELLIDPQTMPLMHASQWYGRAYIFVRMGELERGREGAAIALETTRASGNTYWLGESLFQSGLFSMHARDYAAARRFYSEGLPLFERLPYKMWLQWELDHIAHACYALGDLVAARAYAEEALKVSKDNGLTGQGNYRSLLQTLGRIELDLDRPVEAAWYFERSLDAEVEGDIAHSRVLSMAFLAIAQIFAGDAATAASVLREAIELVRGLEPVELSSGVMQQPPVGSVSQAVCWLAAANGDHESAARLAGASQAWRERQGQARFAPSQQERYERRLETVRAAVGDRFPSLWAEGEALGDQETIELSDAVTRGVLARD